MRTDRLIETLSTNLEPVQPGSLVKSLVLALVVGGLLSFAVMLATIGLRAGDSASIGFLGSKILFALSLVATGGLVLMRSIHPGRNARRPFITFFALLLVALTTCVATFLGRPLAHWQGVILDAQWITCLCCIPLFAIIPFVALLWVLRKGAPTDLRRTGATAGIVAALMGAAVYALRCPADSLLFIAVWYGVAIAFCALVGAMVGPRLLRW